MYSWGAKRRGKEKPVYTFTFQLAFPSYPLTWYNDENISVQPWPSRVWTGAAVFEVLLGSSRWEVGMIFLEARKHSLFPCRHLPYIQWQCKEVI